MQTLQCSLEGKPSHGHAKTGNHGHQAAVEWAKDKPVLAIFVNQSNPRKKKCKSIKQVKWSCSIKMQIKVHDASTLTRSDSNKSSP